jgi:hypothetical protein
MFCVQHDQAELPPPEVVPMSELITKAGVSTDVDLFGLGARFGF